MKIGFCGGMDKVNLFSNDVMDFAEANLTDLSKMSDEQLEELWDKSKKSGIPFETANCFFPPEIKLCGEGYSKTAIEEYAESALSKAQKLGIKTAVVGSGRSRNTDDNKEACFKQLKESFYTIASIGEKYGIIVVLEPLNSSETNTFNTVAEGADFVRDVNHPNLFLLADFYHLSKENEPYQNVIDNSDIIRHIHIARGETRKFPKADDGFDYIAIRDALKQAGYDLRVSIEGGPYEDYDTEIVESVKFLKTIFR